VGHLRRAPSGNWRAAYRTPEGKERTRTFKTKREARAFLAQVEGDKTRGLYVDPAGAQLRLRELADRWWAAREVELTTVSRIAELPHCRSSKFPTSPDTGWVADYRVVVGVTSACLAAARKLSARARWVRIR
jgi:hypothetical protein